MAEKIEKRSDDLKGEVFGGRITTHKWCDSCLFCDVIEPIGRQPQTRYCKIYEPKDSEGKPDEVIYNGAMCEFYEKDKK